MIPKVLKKVNIKKHNDGPISSRIVGYTEVTTKARDQFKVPAIEPANPFTSDEKISPKINVYVFLNFQINFLA